MRGAGAWMRTAWYQVREGLTLRVIVGRPGCVRSTLSLQLLFRVRKSIYIRQAEGLKMDNPVDFQLIALEQ